MDPATEDGSKGGKGRRDAFRECVPACDAALPLQEAWLSHTDSGCHVPRCCHAPYCAASVEGPTSRNAQLPEAGTVVQHVTLRHRGRAVRGVVVEQMPAAGDGERRVIVEWDASARGQVPVEASVDGIDLAAACNLRDAVVRKYGDDEVLSTGAGGDAALAPHLDTQLLARLRTLDLRCCALSSLAGLDASACPNIQAVDISCNLLSSLSDVIAFVRAAPPTLTSLNISENTFASVVTAHDDDDRVGVGALQCAERRLQTLVMNNSNTSWDTLFAFLAAADVAHITELSLADNALECVPEECATVLGELETLRLDGNAIASWSSISALARMACLSWLTLSRNPLRGSWDVEGLPGQEGGAAGRYVALKSVSLNETGVSSWDEVDALARLPALRDLRIVDVPLTRGLSGEEQRMLLIAHLPNVSSGGKGRQTVGSETCGRLNGSMVTANERRDAHRFFLEYWERVPGDRRPWRYAELLRDDPIARKLAGVNDGGCVGVEVSGTVSADLHDGVNATSFHARGLGRCE